LEIGPSFCRVRCGKRHLAEIEADARSADAITNGKGSMFTDQAALTSRNPLDLEWVSGKRERVRLTD
jgi:hypothetical protein